jgi:hypothetical protein
MAGDAGLEPAQCMSQSHVPYQLGESPKNLSPLGARRCARYLPFARTRAGPAEQGVMFEICRTFCFLECAVPQRR